jgi:hypothetical protein
VELGTMSVADDLAELDRDIAEAWTALGSARAAYERSPNVARQTFASMAERTVDELLELRYEMTSTVTA